MANVKVSAPVPASPAVAWRTASDLTRFGEWLRLHEGWRGDVPDEIATGSILTSVVSVKGMRNRVEWAVTEFDPPSLLRLAGDGKGGVKISLAMSVRADGPSSVVGIEVDFSAPGMFGPIGAAVGRTLKGDIRTSIDRLAAIITEETD